MHPQRAPFSSPARRPAWIVLLAVAGLPALFPLRAAVVAHYGFNADFTDDSGNARHGTLVDAAPAANSGVTTTTGDWRFGGGGLNLAADRDYVSLPSQTFASGSPYTLAFWAKKSPGDTGGAAQWDMVIGSVDTTNFFVGLNNGTGLRWRGADSTAQRQADFAAPNDTSWHHYMLSASAAGSLSFFLDGALVSVATNKLTGFTWNAIGEAYTAASDFDFNGWIDEVWVFDQAYGAAEASNLAVHNSLTAPANPPALALHYRFDGDFSDSSGSANPGTPLGNAAITTAAGSRPVGAGALALDGADASRVQIANPVVFTAAQAWSAAFWARRGETGANKGMILGEAGTTDDFIWLNDAFTGLRFRSSTAQTLDFNAAKDQLLHHYALVANGLGALTLYVDGAFAQSLNGNTSLRVDSVGSAYPPASQHYNFQGLLDDVRLYAGALGAADVAALHALGGGPPPPVVASVRVFLLGGQSNADGRGDPAELPTSPVNLQLPQPDIDLYYRVAGGNPALTTLRPGTSASGEFGPDVTFGPELAGWIGADATNRVAIVRYARGGTSLAADWKAGGDASTAGDGPEYVIFQQTAASGLAALSNAYPGARISLEGLLWMQGESDEGSAAAYAANLADFVADARATFGAELPFVIARLSSGQTAIAPGPLATLRAAQQAVADADPRPTGSTPTGIR